MLRKSTALSGPQPRALLVALVVGLGVVVAGTASAGASQAVGCPPQTAELKLLRVPVGQPLDTVVAMVGCLPVDETLSSVVIDWGDGTTSAGTATFQAEPGGVGKTALIRGVHAYATATCGAGDPCPPGYLPKASVVTASDGATLAGGGYGVAVDRPVPVADVPPPATDPAPPPPRTAPAEVARPSLAAGRAAPSVRRRGRRLRVDPHVRATCPPQARCTAKVVVRTARGGQVIASARADFGPGARGVPTVVLPGATARALLAGSTVPVRIDVTVRERGAARAAATRSRRASLRLRERRAASASTR